MHDEEENSIERLVDDDPSIPAHQSGGRILTPSEVAEMFHVDPKTVTRWAKAGKLTYFRTLGGHRRYRENEVLKLLNSSREQMQTVEV